MTVNDFLGGHARQRSCPLRSFSRNISLPMMSQRPDSPARARGCNIGSSICWPRFRPSLGDDPDDAAQATARQEQVDVKRLHEAGRIVARSQQQLWLTTSAPRDPPAG